MGGGGGGQPNIRQGMTQPIQGGNYQEQFNQLFPGSTISLNELMANKDKLESMGMRVVPNAAGTSADIQLPDGSFIDIGAGMSRSGGGPVPKQWNPDAPSGMRVVPNAAGTSADIQLPDGSFIDIGAGMSRSGGGPVPKQWNPDAPAGF